MSVGAKFISSYLDTEYRKFEEIYSENFAVLYIHAYKMLGDRDEANDVVQDVFVTAWEKRHEIIIHTSLKAYLFRAVKNKILNIYSQQSLARKFETTFDAQRYSEIEDEAVREQKLMHLIEEEVSQLPEQMKVVFNMSRMEDKTNAEIAETLDISINTVKTHIGRALKKLRIKFVNFFL